VNDEIGSRSHGRAVRLVLGVACMSLCMASEASAQQSDECRFLCVPSFKVEPTITLEPLFTRPVIEELWDGQVVTRTTQELESTFELVLALGVPTAIPRVGLTFEAILKPFEVVDNEPDIEFEVNLYLMESEHTGGWIESHVDIVDKFSPSGRSGDEMAYTHKLNLEWDTAFRPFTRMADDRYLKHVELEASLDFVATGLPRAGDVIGDRRFADDASPWSVSFLLVFPVAPLLP